MFYANPLERWRAWGVHLIAGGDAVVMAFTRGRDNAGWQATDPNLREIRVNRGHEAQRRR